MEKRFVWFSLAFITIIFGCGTDGAEVAEQETTTEILSPKSFTVLGEDAEAVYQFDFNAEDNNQTLVNLTLEMGVPIDYLDVAQQGEYLSFFTFRDDFFSLYTKNLDTGTLGFYDQFYATTPNRSLAWGVNSGNRAYFGYFDPGSRNLAIHKVGFDGGDGLDTLIDTDVDVSFTPFLFEDNLFISYRDNQGNHKIASYDISDDTVSPILNFEGIPVSFLIDDLGRLAVIKNGVGAQVEWYAVPSMAFIESAQLGDGIAFIPGPMNGNIIANETLFYAQSYAQPSKYPYGPAIFDFISQETTVLDFESIADQVAFEMDTPIGLTTQVYVADKDVFLVGFAKLGDEVGGGVIQLSSSGELLTTVELPFIPTFFINE